MQSFTRISHPGRADFFENCETFLKWIFINIFGDKFESGNLNIKIIVLTCHKDNRRKGIISQIKRMWMSGYEYMLEQVDNVQ